MAFKSVAYNLQVVSKKETKCHLFIEDSAIEEN